jgi:hypothetical protein
MFSAEEYKERRREERGRRHATQKKHPQKKMRQILDSQYREVYSLAPPIMNSKMDSEPPIYDSITEGSMYTMNVCGDPLASSSVLERNRSMFQSTYYL